MSSFSAPALAAAAWAWLCALPLWLLVPLCAAAAVAAAVAALVARELAKPTPRGGSAVTLPNGMRITHWQASETDFLYGEIWGEESAYAGGRGGAAALRFAPGDVVVDAGANIGMFSLYAAARCGGDARIFAFEPIPSTYRVLAANAAAANRGEFGAVFQPYRGARLDVRAFNVGLSDAPANVVFEHHPNFSVWSTADADFAKQRIDRIAGDLPRATSHSPSFLVRLLPSALVSWVGGLVLSKAGHMVKVNARLVTLSSIIESEKIDHIDILKIDVEGAELSVLRGIADKHWHKVQQLVLEVESFAMRDTIVELLAKRGFKTSAVASERERTPGVLSEVCMVYATRPRHVIDELKSPRSKSPRKRRA